MKKVNKSRLKKLRTEKVESTFFLHVFTVDGRLIYNLNSDI